MIRGPRDKGANQRKPCHVGMNGHSLSRWAAVVTVRATGPRAATASVICYAWEFAAGPRTIRCAAEIDDLTTRRSGEPPNDRSAGKLPQYKCHSFHDLFQKNTSPYPSRFVNHREAPCCPNRFWHDLIKGCDFNEDAVRAF